ncbi:FAD binding domain-containing protein [Clostridium swellfunianum]|uniref:FAD binding domain-containing protein n=1 Tax=Clostridium swellfunianum TaxID=1367462 RepID=UPI00202E3B4D|nr:FAD binding domain-containing protein [Clostridium swellfunianum]MCM0650651.1 FAD binding domain-containing protein [Clostridium swellfunianum]
MIKSFVKPKKLQEVLEILNQGSVTILAGGTDIMVEARGRKELLNSVVDISGVEELKGIIYTDNVVSILAGTTHAEVEKSEIIKTNISMLSKACSLVGSTLIRNRATIGGNIANNANCADSIPPLLIYDAKLVLKNLNGERVLSLDEFLGKNGSVNLRPDEILYSIEVEKLVGYKWELVKVGRRKSLAISRMTLAIALKEKDGFIEDLRLCPGAMLPKHTRLYNTEKNFKGQKLTSEVIESIAGSAVEEAIAMSGRRWSAEYKEPVLKGLIIRTLEQWRI